MKTKLSIVAFLSLIALLIVCCSNDETSNNDLQEEKVQTTVENYDFKGQPPLLWKKNKSEVTSKTIKFFEAEGPFIFDYMVDGCSPAPYLTVSGSGIASHLGLYSIINQGCYDSMSPILGTITAANGDEINTYIASAFVDEDTGLWNYHYIIYNGTGNFDGAYGDIYMVGTLDFENFIWNLKGEGTINY
jgi:hypothetical protein